MSWSMRKRNIDQWRRRWIKLLQNWLDIRWWLVLFLLLLFFTTTTTRLRLGRRRLPNNNNYNINNNNLLLHLNIIWVLFQDIQYVINNEIYSGKKYHTHILYTDHLVTRVTMSKRTATIMWMNQSIYIYIIWWWWW